MPSGHIDQDVHDWTARWNDRADREARFAQKLHGGALLALHRQLCEVHEREVSDLCALQELHVAVIGTETKHDHYREAEEEHGVEGPEDLLVERGCPANPLIFQDLPIHFDSAASMLFARFGQTFVQNVIATLNNGKLPRMPSPIRSPFWSWLSTLLRIIERGFPRQTPADPIAGWSNRR